MRCFAGLFEEDLINIGPLGFLADRAKQEELSTKWVKVVKCGKFFYIFGL